MNKKGASFSYKLLTLFLFFSKSESECLILRNATHSGTLTALDFNLFQTNLLASAGSKSEVKQKKYIICFNTG